MLLIEILDGVQRIALHLGIDAFGIRQIKNRLALIAEHHALIKRRQKAAAPVRRTATRPFATGTEHDEGRKVLRFATKPVSGPRADARTAKLLRAGVHENLRR